MPYTNVMDGVWQCNDCGAHAATQEAVVHHGTCQPGESKTWEELYAKDYEESVALLQEAEMLGAAVAPPVLMRSKSAVLMPSDVEVLAGSVNRTVRIDRTEDAEVKRLYHIYKSL